MNIFFPQNRAPTSTILSSTFICRLKMYYKKTRLSLIKFAKLHKPHSNLNTMAANLRLVPRS